MINFYNIREIRSFVFSKRLAILLLITCQFSGLKLFSFCQLNRGDCYAATQDKTGIDAGRENSFNLKARLRLKDEVEKTYWNESDETSWKEEIKNWKFGFLDENNGNAPFVLAKEGFLAAPGQNFCEVNNGATLSVLNPFKRSVRAKLHFFLKSEKKNNSLWFVANGKPEAKIDLSDTNSESGFQEVELRDVLLVPGNNKIVFCAGTEKYGTNPTIKNKNYIGKKSLFVSLKNDIKIEVESFQNVLSAVSFPLSSYVADTESLNLLFLESLNDNSLFLMSREFQIDLEEYPYFSLMYSFIDTTRQKLSVFFGIDNNNDGKIDGYLNTSSVLDINLLEAAKEKWVTNDWHIYPSFLLKSIIMVVSNKKTSLDSKKKKDSVDYFNLKLDRFCFFSYRSIVTLLSKNSIRDLKIIPHTHTFVSRFIDSPILDKKEKEISLLEINVFYKKGVVGACCGVNEQKGLELKLPFSVNSKNSNRDTYLSFSYWLQNREVQELNVALGLDEDGNGKIDKEVSVLPTVENNSTIDYSEAREVNLSKCVSNLAQIKEVIFRISQKEGVFRNSWYRFYIKDNIKSYRKFPATLKSLFLKESLLSELRNLDVPIVEIDGLSYAFSKIVSPSLRMFDNGYIDFGEIFLSSGDHKIKLIDNELLKTEWVSLKPSKEFLNKPYKSEPQILFKKFNQTYYVIKVKGAKSPFWLVFQESFNPSWKLFIQDKFDIGTGNTTDYKELRVEEAPYNLKFNIFDLKYVFRKPLSASHRLVNFYANGWYIDPKTMALPEDFTLVLYFWPQGLYGIGLIISIATLAFCLILLSIIRSKNEKNTRF